MNAISQDRIAANRANALKTFLNENMSQLAEREAKCQKKEEKEVKARQTYAVLPSVEALEKLGRYESMLNRQLFRAMKELRTLQEKRRGKDRNPTSRNPKEIRSPKSERAKIYQTKPSGQRSHLRSQI
jgi:hypothetical protein